MRLHLGGHLAWYDAQRRSWLDVSLPEPVGLAELAARLNLPPGEIAIAAVNGRMVPVAGTNVADGDRVELYPPMGGGAAPGDHARSA